MKIPLEYRSVPIAPSHSMGRCLRRETRSVGMEGSPRVSMQCTTNARMAGSGCAASVCYNRDFPATSLMATERLKRAIILAFCAGALAILPSCGGGNSNSSSAPQVSKIKKRAFVTNNFANQIEILNAANDTVNTTFVTSTNGTTTQSPTNLIRPGTNPAQMVVTSDKKLTLVFDQGSNV